MGLFWWLDGNISKMSWRSLGGNNSSNTNAQTYDYTYDPLSRLKSANYSSSGLNNHFNVDNLLYDANGNIQRLGRKRNGDNLDLLTYAYSGNQLISVEDAGDRFDGFENGITEAVEYEYDADGNMTKDLNKGIAHISYNHLNLSTKVSFENGDYVKYTYDATGIKLRKESSTEGNLTTTDYVAGKHYIDNSLSFLQHA